MLLFLLPVAPQTWPRQMTLSIWCDLRAVTREDKVIKKQFLLEVHEIRWATQYFFFHLLSITYNVEQFHRLVALDIVWRITEHFEATLLRLFYFALFSIWSVAPHTLAMVGEKKIPPFWKMAHQIFLRWDIWNVPTKNLVGGRKKSHHPKKMPTKEFCGGRFAHLKFWPAISLITIS